MSRFKGILALSAVRYGVSGQRGHADIFNSVLTYDITSGEVTCIYWQDQQCKF